MAAVRAPAQPTELRGLDAALAAFAVAPGVALSPEEKPPVLKTLAGKLLALKILAIAAGTAAAGGVAYAAVNGSLDSPHGSSAVVAGESSGAPGSSGADSSAPGSDESSSGMSGSGSESESSGSSSGSESGKPSESNTPSPSLQGLCTAWLAHPRDIAKVSTNPAFSVLIQAAGGATSVNGYCTTLLATVHPSHPAHPTHPVHPTNAQNTKSPNPQSSHSSHTLPPQAQNGQSHKKH